MNKLPKPRDAFDLLADSLGVQRPTAQDGYPTVSWSSGARTISLTCSDTNQSTQVTITADAPPSDNFVFQLITGAGQSYVPGGPPTDNNQINTMFERKANDATRLAAIVSGELATLISQLSRCNLELTKNSELIFLDNRKMTKASIPMYVSLMQTIFPKLLDKLQSQCDESKPV